MVGGADGAGWGRDGRKAPYLHREGTPRPRSTGREGAWARVSAHHLWSGVHAAGEPRAPAAAGPRGKAVTGIARVRVGNRGTGAVCPRRAAAARARVRVRGVGPGERACGSTAVGR